MNPLATLDGGEIQNKGLLISTGEALRLFMKKRPEVIALKRSILANELDFSDIDDYVNQLLHSFRVGEKFPYEINLAAIAVILENYPGEFPTKFLEDLSNLRIQEMPLAPRVARLCLLRRSEIVVGVTERKKVIADQDSSYASQIREAKVFWVTSSNQLIGPNLERVSSGTS